MEKNRPMKLLAVAGNTTDIGKTAITTALYAGLLAGGRKVMVQKWISTGDLKGYPEDLLRVLAAELPGERTPIGADLPTAVVGRLLDRYRDKLPVMSPYSFPFPLSPHLAGRLRGIRPDPRKIDACVAEARRSGVELLLVETAGGILTPFNDDLLMLDMVRREGAPVLLVIPDTLGAINQTLLCLNELKRRKIGVKAVVLNSAGLRGSVISRGNKEAIRRFGKVRTIITFPRVRDMAAMKKAGIGLVRELGL